ncbi:angiopoietin-related protein 4 [Tachysurus fulvidraco]|uniref:angiopoietin-related protein 4 n=1 Tax=Tachysurus fulvidraco TaxID=1234273 RepID=UPI000F4FEA94|nr:angiopoietin-related protein 4 [Tachysurus fulvidraco]
MKMKLSELLCLTVLVSSGSGSPYERRSPAVKEKRVQYAAWDDVNVLAHGLLQLGQSLKEHVDKTKGQIRDISVKLRVFNGSVDELTALTRRLHVESEALKERAGSLEEKHNRILNMSDLLLRDRQSVQDRIGDLEGKVDIIMQTHGHALNNRSDARAIQSLLETQNRRIDELVERIKQQQEKLDKQNIRIRALQNQIQMKKEKLNPSARRTEQQDTPPATAANCHDVFLRGETASGVYRLQPQDSSPIHVYCQMTSDAGWTIIQRRHDGSVDFDQLWNEYQNGFGNLDGEFWLGLEKMYHVTKDEDFILKIQMTDWRNELQSVQYRIHLNGEHSNYSLQILESSDGNLESSLSTESSSLPFSTRDRDNDRKHDFNCAKHLSGGWWFSNCGRSNLNGRYFITPPKQRHQRKQGMFWKTWHGRYYSLKSTVMMILPVR